MRSARTRARRRRAVVRGLAGLAAVTAPLVVATAAEAAPAYFADVAHAPQNLPPGGRGMLTIAPYNVGQHDTGGTVTIAVTLPAGVTAGATPSWAWTCAGTGTGQLSCTNDGSPIPAVKAGGNDHGDGPLLTLPLDVASNASSGQIVVRVSGAGAATATFTDPAPVSSALVPFGFTDGTVVGDAFDGTVATGQPVRQAGAHPFEYRVRLNTNLHVRENQDGEPFSEPVENLKTLTTRMPLGLVGNPEAAPKCRERELLSGGWYGGCPAQAQIGTIDLVLSNLDDIAIANQLWPTTALPVWNMEPPPGAVAAFAFAVLAQPSWITITVDPRDQSLVATLKEMNGSLPIRSADLTLWGVPADPAHDRMRFNVRGESYGASADSAAQPFLTLPSQCGVERALTLSADSWLHPGRQAHAQAPGATYTGCDDRRFDFRPAVAVRADTREPSTPTGVTVELTVPQTADRIADRSRAAELYASSGRARALATPPVDDVTITLPEGMAISPSSADGLQACAPAQIALGTDADPACPDGSRIGTVTVETPVLPEPMTGGVYLASQNDNPFGSTLALYLVAQGSNVTLKLPGKIAPDPLTGRITATFSDNPQLPFSKLTVKLKGGPRAPLVNPAVCGVKTTTATVTSWNGAIAPVTSTDPFTVAGGACTVGFDPSFAAGGRSSRAGRDSPLVVRFGRGDRDEELRAVDVALPEGLLGRIAALDLCGDADAAAGRCGEGARIGTANVDAGPGTSPFQLAGRVYMTGPYKDAPFGLSIVVPAKAGPLDLGTVVVRAAVHVDRATAQLRIVSDPLPRILEGIPLQIRLVDVNVDRPGFTFNPTGCSASGVEATISSVGGKTAAKRSRFQVAGCAALPYKPKLTLKMGAKGRARGGVTAPLSVALAMTPGQANNRSVSVSLPRNVNARLEVIKARACSLEQYKTGTCPQSDRIGTAQAATPLLKEALRGDLFFVRNPARRLPDLMVALRGQVSIDLTGKVTVNSDLTLRTDFDTIPDVPITRFDMRIVAGRNGPIGFVASPCTKKARAERARIGFAAHSGKAATVRQPLTIVGCPARR